MGDSRRLVCTECAADYTKTRERMIGSVCLKDGCQGLVVLTGLWPDENGRLYAKVEPD